MRGARSPAPPRGPAPSSVRDRPWPLPILAGVFRCPAAGPPVPLPPRDPPLNALLFLYRDVFEVDLSRPDGVVTTCTDLLARGPAAVRSLPGRLVGPWTLTWYPAPPNPPTMDILGLRNTACTSVAGPPRPASPKRSHGSPWEGDRIRLSGRAMSPSLSSSVYFSLCGRNERRLVVDTQRERRAACSYQRPFRPDALTAMTPKHTVSEAHGILMRGGSTR